MLVKFTDVKDVNYWVNPLHVKMLREKKGLTEIFIVYNPGWAAPSFKVKQSAEEVAALLDAAMPDAGALVPDDDQAAAKQAHAG
ncbi:MAG: hypothetical protein IT439_07670 [Phycisphaerales bacterium]|nr:hypothetical protein [Phycisphaerales bacterium]